MKTHDIVLLLVITLFLDACNSDTQEIPPPSTRFVIMYETTETAAKISRIATQVKDLTVLDDLFEIKEFLEIYENPQSYVEAAIALIQRTDLSILNKKIIALSMQKLPVTQFLALISVTADAVEKQTTNAKVLELMIFPPFNWGAQLTVNYEKHEVQALLNRLVEISQLSDNTRNIIANDILTGRAKQNFQQYREMQGLPY
ncbi:hypothetical protein PN36_32175 [Candidatus Thiomargarita nelsonii]|uniref:Uncharacterized protein n=1 Tax=Candidatus Thiomargarita nelsonii TaxID=1003181 RepID=A0A0A6RPR0_9GAMM|nr:hypothetical protein PN36_32175 [Candidatus Thiomargarita nelsonii]